MILSFDFISQFLNVISIVAIYNSKDSEEKEKIMEIFKINIQLYEAKMRSQLNEYLKKMIELKIKDIHFFSAFKLIVSYAKKEINFDQFLKNPLLY